MFTSTSQVTIGVFPANNGINQAPAVNAAPTQLVVLPNKGMLNGSASHDGLPTNTLTVFWQQIQRSGHRYI